MRVRVPATVSFLLSPHTTELASSPGPFEKSDFQMGLGTRLTTEHVTVESVVLCALGYRTQCPHQTFEVPRL